MSSMLGTLRKVTGASVRRQAASIGWAEFLFPAGVISPCNGRPPSTISFSIELLCSSDER